MAPARVLDDLSPGEESQWSGRVLGELNAAILNLRKDEEAPPVRIGVDETCIEHRVLEWPANPARLERCLGRRRALRLLDWVGKDGTPHGRIRHQDEYLEWRVVRDAGRIRAIEVTTEFPEYWEVLAGYAPSRTLELLREFSGGAHISTEAVYGKIDPFNGKTTPAARIAAFRSMMLATGGSNRFPRGPTSPFNNGAAALCCMIHRDNSLAALLRLVVSSARPYLVRDRLTGRTRFPSGSEAILGMQAWATDFRNSDPLVVERIVRWGTEGRLVALDEPIGIFIRAVQHHELAQSDGSDVPETWFTWSRGHAASLGPAANARYQRLRLEVPPDADFGIDDLIVRRTGEPLMYGGQLAELIQLALYVRTSPALSLVDTEPEDPMPPILDCSDGQASWEAFSSTGTAT